MKPQIQRERGSLDGKDYISSLYLMPLMNLAEHSHSVNSFDTRWAQTLAPCHCQPVDFCLQFEDLYEDYACYFLALSILARATRHMYSFRFVACDFTVRCHCHDFVCKSKEKPADFTFDRYDRMRSGLTPAAHAVWKAICATCTNIKETDRPWRR